MRRLALLAAVALAACTNDPATAEATVTVSVLASYGAQPTDGCRPATGYTDVATGTVLTLTDDDGAIVDRAELDQGRLEVDAGNTRTCRFEATFTGVPDDPDTELVLTVASRSGEVLATGAELVAGTVEADVRR